MLLTPHILPLHLESRCYNIQAMISYYPTHLLPYLSLKSNKLNQNIARQYYLSWEDALWELLPQLGFELGSTILLPDFYCLDVIENIKNHGYKVALYPLDNNFQISMAKFQGIYAKSAPSVVIFFHACGITNTLTTNNSFMKRLANKSLIVDDHVHRIIDTNHLNILHDRHLIIDSLRKNLPLPGSFVYASKSTLSKLRKPSNISFSYGLRVFLYFLMYRTTLLLGDLLRVQFLIKYAHLRLLKTHDNLVGDSERGYPGLQWIPLIHQHINLSKIRTLKIKQVQYYQKHLAYILQSSSHIHLPLIESVDFGELHALPLIIDLPSSIAVEEELSLINVWTKFSDSPWSKNRRAFFLPLGFHITQLDQDLIVRAIIKSAQTK